MLSGSRRGGTAPTRSARGPDISPTMPNCTAVISVCCNLTGGVNEVSKDQTVQIPCGRRRSTLLLAASAALAGLAPASKATRLDL